MARRPYMIGIAGPSCSGKTELARGLTRKLAAAGPALVSLDAYYRDLSAIDPLQRAAVNFDHPGALDRNLFFEQLDALSRGETVDLPRYDFASHTRVAGSDPIRPGAVVIVEGLHVLHWEHARRRLDLKIFIDAGRDLCLQRRLERDVLSRGRTAGFVRRQFATTVRPMYERHVHPTRRFADLILDGAAPLQRGLERAAARVEAALGTTG